MNKKEKAIRVITWSLMVIGVGLAIYGGIVKNPTLLWTGVSLAILSIIIGSIYTFAFREKKEVYIKVKYNNNTTLRNLLLKVKLDLLNEFVDTDKKEWMRLDKITENPELAEKNINKLFEYVKNSSGLGDSYYGTFLSKEFLDFYFEAIYNQFYLRLSIAKKDTTKTDIVNDLNRTINYISERGLFGAIENDGGILRMIANIIQNNPEETKERKDLANFILNNEKVEKASDAIYKNKNDDIANKDFILERIIGSFDPDKIKYHCCIDVMENNYKYKIQSTSKIPFNIQKDSASQGSGMKNTK